MCKTAKYCYLFGFLLLKLNLLSQLYLNKERFYLPTNSSLLEDYKFDFQYYTDSTFINYRKNMNFEIAPNLQFAQEKNNFYLQNGFQANFYGNYKYLVSLYIQYNAGYTNRTNTIYESGLQTNSFFSHHLSGNNYLYQDLRARMVIQGNKYISFQVGIDKHHIGEGDRSLLMGNQGIPNPFALLKFNFWKLEYINLQQIWRDGLENHYVPKGNSSHYISFKPSKKFSFGIFESVTHLIKDTLYNKGFDVEYLNPLIFYRPQEYSLGSTDNVILGLNTHVTFNKTMLYGQFILDEFLLSNLKARNRWWGNKYGGQLGIKSIFDIGKTTFFIRSEFNIVRPYTYSHNKANLNFSNQNIPVAHPLGSNFVEWYNEVETSIGKNKFHFWSNWYLKGEDSLGSSNSYGGDILKDYSLKPLGKDTLYYIGSGNKINHLQFALQISRQITKYKWEVFVEPRIIFLTKNKNITSSGYFTFGLRSRFNHNRRNY